MKMFSNHRYNYIVWLVILSLLPVTLGGCAKGTEEADIELLDPVGVATNYDIARVRDIYQAEVYSGISVPAVTEFAYTPNEPFESYGKLPGEEVVTGDVLMYADTAGLEESYEQLLKETEEKADAYEWENGNLQEDLYDAKKAEYEASVPYMESLSNMPEETAPGYDMWAGFSMPAEAAYKAAVLARERIEQKIIEQNALFALEQEYDQSRLNRMTDAMSDAQITTNMDGTIVAMNFYVSGDTIEKNTNVVAVGDMNRKVIHTEYISKAKVEKAKEVYALVDGKRYEVIYEVMEKEEYARIKKLNDVVYSTFYLEDSENEIPMGKSVTLVVVTDSRTNVLSVLSDALYQNGQDYYCYFYDGTTSTMKSVTVGLSDGMYTEITYGLQEGDRVLINEPVNAKGKMAFLEKGTIKDAYEGSGVLYYPSTEWIENPAKFGTFYISEICVEQYEQVQAGQELIKIEVISDEIEIGRIERQLQRQQERLNRLLDKKSKIYSDEVDRSLERAIASRQRTIEDLNEDLNELTQYMGEVVLVAPYDGIITELSAVKEGDLISYRQKLVQIADRTLCYVLVEDKNGLLSYGNEAVVTYVTEHNVKKEITGTVVSVNGTALSKQLQTGYALILLSSEDAKEIVKYGSAVMSDGDWNRSRFEVTAQIDKAADVLLVPKRAVTIHNKNTFVKVKNEDGSFVYVSFIAGGSSSEYYWVARGLYEGMEICLE